MSELVMWSAGIRESVGIREDRWLKRGVTGGPADFNEPFEVTNLIFHED